MGTACTIRQEFFAIDEGTLGLLMLCSGFGSICALPLSGFLVNRFGAKKVVYVSGLLMAFALLAISLLINIWLTGVMLMVLEVVPSPLMLRQT